MKYIKLYETYNIENLLDTTKVYDIQFNGEPSYKGDKISIVGKSMNNVYDLYNRLHDWLSLKNIAHKIATKKRVEHSDYEQSKKLVTIYVPDTMDIFDLMNRIEILLKGYKGWQDIKLPFKGYEHFSNAIFFRNDKDEMGNYIPAKLSESINSFYKEIEFVCHNSDSNTSSNKEAQKNLFLDLKKLQKQTNYSILPYMQDFSDLTHDEISLAVIILDKDNEKYLEHEIFKLSKKWNVEFDLYQERSDKQVNSIMRGDYWDNIILEKISFEDDLGEMKYIHNNSYIKFEIMDDTYNIVEFNPELDLDDIYSTIGERVVYISEMYLDPNDSPILIKTFLEKVEEFALENEESTIVLIAEPFKDKRQSLKKLVSFYSNMGYEYYSKLGSGVIMFKNLD